MVYFLAFVLLATFIARKKLVSMLREEIKDNENLADMVTVKKKDIIRIKKPRK